MEDDGDNKTKWRGLWQPIVYIDALASIGKMPRGVEVEEDSVWNLWRAGECVDCWVGLGVSVDSPGGGAGTNGRCL